MQLEAPFVIDTRPSTFDCLNSLLAVVVPKVREEAARGGGVAEESKGVKACLNKTASSSCVYQKEPAPPPPPFAIAHPLNLAC